MKTLFATWLLEPAQGKALYNQNANNRLLSYYFTKKKEQDFKGYVRNGFQRGKKIPRQTRNAIALAWPKTWRSENQAEINSIQREHIAKAKILDKNTAKTNKNNFYEIELQNRKDKERNQSRRTQGEILHFIANSHEEAVKHAHEYIENLDSTSGSFLRTTVRFRLDLKFESIRRIA